MDFVISFLSDVLLCVMLITAIALIGTICFNQIDEYIFDFTLSERIKNFFKKK